MWCGRLVTLVGCEDGRMGYLACGRLVTLAGCEDGICGMWEIGDLGGM